MKENQPRYARASHPQQRGAPLGSVLGEAGGVELKSNDCLTDVAYAVLYRMMMPSGQRRLCKCCCARRW